MKNEVLNHDSEILEKEIVTGYFQDLGLNWEKLKNKKILDVGDG